MKYLVTTQTGRLLRRTFADKKPKQVRPGAVIVDVPQADVAALQAELDKLRPGDKADLIAGVITIERFADQIRSLPIRSQIKRMMKKASVVNEPTFVRLLAPGFALDHPQTMLEDVSALVIPTGGTAKQREERAAQTLLKTMLEEALANEIARRA